MDQEFKDALVKFFDEQLDQWEMFRIETQFGPVFITFSRECIHGEPRNYDDV